jgi:hypothetical protein
VSEKQRFTAEAYTFREKPFFHQKSVALPTELQPRTKHVNLSGRAGLRKCLGRSALGCSVVGVLRVSTRWRPGAPRRAVGDHPEAGGGCRPAQGRNAVTRYLATASRVCRGGRNVAGIWRASGKLDDARRHRSAAARSPARGRRHANVRRPVRALVAWPAGSAATPSQAALRIAPQLWAPRVLRRATCCAAKLAAERGTAAVGALSTGEAQH